MRTDGWTDMTKLMVTFCSFVNVPKKAVIFSEKSPLEIISKTWFCEVLIRLFVWMYDWRWLVLLKQLFIGVHLSVMQAEKYSNWVSGFTSYKQIWNFMKKTNKYSCNYTRWFKYDRDKLWLVYTQIVPVIFEPPCTFIITVAFVGVLHSAFP